MSLIDNSRMNKTTMSHLGKITKGIKSKNILED